MNATATFRRGGQAVPASSDPATLAAQIAHALSGGPVPMPPHWVGFDPAAVPQYRLGLICRTCGATFRSDGDAIRHDEATWNRKAQAFRCKSTWLPAVA